MESITFALSKGRIAEAFLKAFDAEEALNSRKLIVQVGNIKMIMVKPVDVPTYVANGVADIGVVGRDVILESGESFYELLEFPFSKCTLSIAGFDQNINLEAPMTIATKYPKICKQYFPLSKTIYLNGSVELAPILNLSDVIFDIVETGTTLKENGLSVIKDVLSINPVLIANKSSYKFNQAQIDAVINQLNERGDL
ncbi:ATP phosphoribosyltransferase [Fusibacter ferrireducens]|uniref:ATP phosphoribosyltransferase n=1 Tax=Fusibacter ferrireducens TaxID=2785058 RepID=A0ABR9ZUJ8_9FIRM|nr:ATP phosphoribosyltransferase [Fusibacter ferrireducens]MBF4694149.1 ATP phosphoribosyltransferase [Fusibacter ferrireducens]